MGWLWKNITFLNLVCLGDCTETELSSLGLRCESRLNSQWWYLVSFMSFWGFWSMLGHAQLSLLIMGGGAHWGIDNCRLFNYLSDLADNWLKGVYMCQDDTCEIISQSDNSFNSYAQKSKCSICLAWGLLGSVWKSEHPAVSDTKSDYAIRCTSRCCHSTCTGENGACIILIVIGLQKETNI